MRYYHLPEREFNRKQHLRRFLAAVQTAGVGPGRGNTGPIQAGACAAHRWRRSRCGSTRVASPL